MGLTSVSVGGLVEHEHGVVHLRGRQTTSLFLVFFFWFFLPLLPRDILPDLSPSQVLQGEAQQQMDRKEGWGQEGRGDERRGVTKRRLRGHRQEDTKKSCTASPVQRLTDMTGGTASWVPPQKPPHNPLLPTLTFPWQPLRKST